jgi:hypothetical protein
MTVLRRHSQLGPFGSTQTGSGVTERVEISVEKLAIGELNPQSSVPSRNDSVASDDCLIRSTGRRMYVIDLADNNVQDRRTKLWPGRTAIDDIVASRTKCPVFFVPPREVLGDRRPMDAPSRSVFGDAT